MSLLKTQYWHNNKQIAIGLRVTLLHFYIYNKSPKLIEHIFRKLRAIKCSPLQLYFKNRTGKVVDKIRKFKRMMNYPATPQDISPSQIDDEFKAIVQHRLIILVHAFNCKSAGNPYCAFSFCRVMKQLLTHMVFCHNTESCTYPHCQSSAQILHHWTYCKTPECSVCSLLKRTATNEAEKKS